MQSMASNLEFKLNVNLRLVKPVFMQSTAGNLEFKPKVIFKLLSCNRPYMTVKLQTEPNLRFLSVKGGCTSSSESALVKIPHCWKSHVTAQL